MSRADQAEREAVLRPPSIDRMAGWPSLQPLIDRAGRGLVIEALRAWMLLLVDYIAAKHIIAPALNTIAGGASRLHEGSRDLIQDAIDGLVKRAKRNGDLRRDLDAHDLLRALIGVSHVGSGGDWQQSARRLVDILIAGSRPLK